MTANLFGGSGDPNRGTWRTPKWLAKAVGVWDLDPFANPVQHVSATTACMLERGENGLELGDILEKRNAPGTHRVAKLGAAGGARVPGELARAPGVRIADESTRVWIQPPYEIVDDVITHYGHTRFCALLRFDTRTAWFDTLYRLVRTRRGLICATRGSFNFEPPPGVAPSSNIFPHALFYADARDATQAVLRRCFAWRP